MWPPSFSLSCRNIVCIFLLSNGAVCPAHLILNNLIIVLISGKEYSTYWCRQLEQNVYLHSPIRPHVMVLNRQDNFKF
jgi:hypothetical protein